MRMERSKGPKAEPRGMPKVAERQENVLPAQKRIDSVQTDASETMAERRPKNRRQL